jgi:type VI protein secretion system component VasF
MEESKKSAAALVQRAIVSLGVAEGGVRDTASAIFNLTSEIKDIARDLKDTAQGFRALQPERLTKEIEALKAAQRRTLQTAVAAAAASLAVVILLIFSR